MAGNTSFPELQRLPIDEIQRLLDDDTALLNFFSTLPQVKAIQDRREALAKEVEEQARKNMERKPEYEEKRQQLSDTYDELTTMRQTYDQLVQRQADLSEKYSPPMILTQLRIDASAVDEEAEQVAESFLSGSLPVDEFVSQFMEKKKLSHTRHAKVEKLSARVEGRW
eukprot:scpid80712/ scgid32853/ Vacuolar protein sorting-associated protein 37A; ESCRT-I complex subunit VPS37A; Hepatocellular carcinoma-related protein 1